MKAPILPQVEDVPTSQALGALEKTVNELTATLLVDARLVGPVPVATTDTRVRHGLGRRLVGYFLVKAPADVRVFDGATPEANDPANFVSLRASSAQTVTLMVF